MDPTQKEVKDSVQSELASFLGKVEGLFRQNGTPISWSKNHLMDNMMNSLLPSQSTTRDQYQLQDFLKSTISNSFEKKAQCQFFQKSFTNLSGTDRLFDSLARDASRESLFGSSKSYNKQGLIQNGLMDPAKLVKSQESQRESYGSHQLSFHESIGHNSLHGSYFSNAGMSSEGPDLKDSDRRQYQLYSTKVKQEIVDYSRLYGIRGAASKYSIRPHKIKLWAKAFNREKQARGRKPTDPSMENRICEWLDSELKKGTHITQKIIREKAKALSQCDEFKASKGWLEKFFKRRPELFEGYTRNRMGPEYDRDRDVPSNQPCEIKTELKEQEERKFGTKDNSIFYSSSD